MERILRTREIGEDARDAPRARPCRATREKKVRCRLVRVGIARASRSSTRALAASTTAPNALTRSPFWCETSEEKARELGS